MSESTALIVAPSEAPTALMPMAMGKTFAAYKGLQGEIDKAMPDQIMTISGRQFRKKGYWRAVRAAFHLRVECVKEERIEHGSDWGYSVVYRAEGGNGMSADGDGCCMASEKRGAQGTEHNVRSHAHTRGFNRAVSNLVGFGEVSAEEVERDDAPIMVASKPAAVRSPATPSPRPLMTDDTIPDPPEMGPEDGAVVDTTATIYVTEVRKLKSGEGKRGPWTLYLIKFSDGSEGTTFADMLAVEAEDYKVSHAPVLPSLVPDAKSSGKFNVASIVRV